MRHQAGAALMPRNCVGNPRAASAAEVDWHSVDHRPSHLEPRVVLSLRISGDVDAVLPVVFRIADAMFVKASLPDLPGVAGLHPHRVGESAFDALRAAFKGLVPGRRKKQMDVVRHDHKRMERVALLVAVAEEGFTEEQRVAVNLEKTSPIRGDDGDEVG